MGCVLFDIQYKFVLNDRNKCPLRMARAIKGWAQGRDVVDLITIKLRAKCTASMLFGENCSQTQ